MLSDRQQAELDRWSRMHPQAGMRLKALAVRAVARGHTRQQVGAILHVSPYTVGQGTGRTSKGVGRPCRLARVAGVPPVFGETDRSRLVKAFVGTQQGRVALKFLPAYAPELNPVEYLWGFWKTHELANCCPKNFGELSRWHEETMNCLTPGGEEAA